MTYKVTGIERTKWGRFSIYLDGEYFCVLHADVFYLSGLAPGMTVTEDEVLALRAQSEERITKDRALRLLGGRAYTEKGLYDKLREKTDECTAAAAVAYMCELELVDDEKYAKSYAEEVIANKGFGGRRVIQELMKRGIPRDMAEEVAEGLAPEPEQAIARLVLKKYKRYLSDKYAVSKVSAALARFGYGYGDIRTVIRNLQEDEAYYDE